MQDFGNPKSRNTMRAASGTMESAPSGPFALNGGKQAGGNATQGQGTLPSKVSVPLPGTNATQPTYKGGMKQNTPGFQGGIIPGKV
jgi:hypothetical protein